MARIPTDRPRRARGRPAPPPSLPVAPIVTVAGGLVLVALVYLLSVGGGDEALGERPTAAAPARPAAAGKAAARPERNGAPALPDTVLTDADRLYDAANALWSKAQGQREAGETAAYGQTLREAWSKLEEQRGLIAPFTEWLEHADLEGWSVPAEYAALQERFERYDPLRRKVQKLMPTGR
jgi:hypothetical protein